MNGIYFSPKPGRLMRNVSWALLEAHVERIASALDEELWRPDVIVGVFQGGWIVAQLLADFFPSANIVGATSKLKDGDFQPTLVSTEDDTSEIVSDVIKAKRRVLIVDEVVESGRTLSFHKSNLETFCDSVAEIRTACVFAFETANLKPDYVGEMVDQEVSFVLPWRAKRDAPTTSERDTRELRASKVGDSVE